MSKDANRIRERTPRLLGGNAGFLYYIDSGGHEAQYQIVDPIHVQKTEYMRDTHGYKRCDFNPCFHDKLIVSGIRPVKHVQSYVDGSPDHTWVWTTGGVSADGILHALRNLELPVGEWFSDFSARAENHFSEVIVQTHSIVNFLIELIQLCELNIKKLKTVALKWEIAVNRFFEMYKRTSNFWLSWNFCIKPTVKDLEAIRDAGKAVEKRLKWLRKRNHLDTKVKYREGERSFEGDFEFEPTFLGLPLPVSAPPLPTDCNFRADYTALVRPSSYAWVRYDLPDDLLWDNMGAFVALYLEMSWIYNPAQIVWEATPFSWMIDWFVNVKTQLLKRQLSISPFPRAKIHATGHSVHTKIMGDIHFVHPNGAEEFYGSYHYEAHKREPGLPEGDPFPLRIPIEWYNASILASLIGQKRRRKNSSFIFIDGWA